MDYKAKFARGRCRPLVHSFGGRHPCLVSHQAELVSDVDSWPVYVPGLVAGPVSVDVRVQVPVRLPGCLSDRLPVVFDPVGVSVPLPVFASVVVPVPVPECASAPEPVSVLTQVPVPLGLTMLALVFVTETAVVSVPVPVRMLGVVIERAPLVSALSVRWVPVTEIVFGAVFPFLPVLASVLERVPVLGGALGVVPAHGVVFGDVVGSGVLSVVFGLLVVPRCVVGAGLPCAGVVEDRSRRSRLSGLCGIGASDAR
jgi:hypothetical protein